MFSFVNTAPESDIKPGLRNYQKGGGDERRASMKKKFALITF